MMQKINPISQNIEVGFCCFNVLRNYHKLCDKYNSINRF